MKYISTKSNGMTEFRLKKLASKYDEKKDRKKQKTKLKKRKNQIKKPVKINLLWIFFRDRYFLDGRKICSLSR